MSNKFRIPEDVEAEIRNRDTKCVYCNNPMIYPWQSSNRKHSATIEHLREVKPFYWTEKGLRTGLEKEDLAICCGSCNSSRGKKKLWDWLQKSSYCKENGINENTVADPVKEYLKKNSGK